MSSYTSAIAYAMALKRIEQAGAKLISAAQLACELQREWKRHETANNIIKALVDVDPFYTSNTDRSTGSIL